MINRQLKQRDIKDKNVLNVMGRLPRENFLSDNFKNYAYDDNPLPIGKNQTISQPYMVALMTQLLQLTGKESVLEIGTGSGYQTAVLAELAAEVYTVERFETLSGQAKIILDKLKIINVKYLVGDGTAGWQEHAPYDRIIVTAGAPKIPNTLIKQLNNNGIMVIPVGNSDFQILQIVTKFNNQVKIKKSIACTFVPLKGEFGWQN